MTSSYLIKCRFILLCAFALDKLAKAGLEGYTRVIRSIITSILNLIGCSFVPTAELPRAVTYQGILAMKHIMALESLDLTFRRQVLVAVIAQIEVSTYQSFFDLVAGSMK